MSAEAEGVLDNKGLVENGIPIDLTCRGFEVSQEGLDALAQTDDILTREGDYRDFIAELSK